MLFRQSFASYSAGSLLNGYDMVLCEKCGAGYACDLPEQAAFDRYYAEMSKYEYTATSGAADETAAARFQEIVDAVAPFLATDARIADVGCATGGLLAQFRRRGFNEVTGFDPAPYSATAARRLYDLEVRTRTIDQLSAVDDRFDLVLLTGVLEHVRDLDGTMAALQQIIDGAGQLYIEVPDASRYDEQFGAPFQFLSMEHINYFSPISLRNLLGRHGFIEVFTRRIVRRLSPQALEPTVAALFKRSSKQPHLALARDEETEAALTRYIAQSRALEERILRRIDHLVGARRPLAVWGVGTHTLRLLQTSNLAEANLVSFLDSNVHYQGKMLAGFPVVSPASFNHPAAEILISSQTAEHEIFELITCKLGWPNVVHRLYEEQERGMIAADKCPAI